MNNNEAQRILDKGAIPFCKFRRAIKDNDILSEEEKQALYDIVISCEKAREDGSDYDYSEAIDRVANVINNHPATRDYDLGYNDVPMVAMEMPFLIKQVLFYLYYQIKIAENGKKSNKFTIEDFMARLSSNGVCKTKKFLNVGGLTPEKYFTMTQYNQPINPCKYKGQKKEELAEAIKNLAYQAGSYTYYVDVFGGSGSATTALFPQDKVKQVYNEKNRAVYNLFEVISSERYKEMQKAIQNIQEDLRSDSFDFDRFYKFDIASTIDKYIEFKENNKNLDERALDAIDEEKELLSMVGAKFIFDENRVINFMTEFPQKVDEYVSSSSYDGVPIEEMRTWNTKEDFENNFRIIRCFSDEYLGFFGVRNMTGRYSLGNVYSSYFNYLNDIRKIKALGYFAHFYLLRNTAGKISEDRKVEYAVGEIYLQYMSTQGDIISSAILAFNAPMVEHNSKSIVNSFMADKLLEDEIKEFHNRVSRCYKQGLLRNQDFSKVIEEFSEEKGKTLFYVDSPYIGTSDYGDKANGVKDFKSDHMCELISKLTESGEKFIFSMRAVITGGKKADKIKKNKSLKECVYTPFESYSNKLYVLVILKSGKDLGNAISKSEVVEIMITNYPIVSFDNYKKSKKTQFKYEAYKYNDFMDIIDKNMLV